MTERSRSFGPVVLAGLGGAGLAAMAGNESWLTVDQDASGCVDPLMTIRADSSPGTTALALALLAAWGVLLVTRGRFRRLTSVLALLLSLGVAVTVVLGVQTDECAHRSGWYWVAVASLPLAVGAALLAVRLVPRWPEMGRKYDAPAGAPPAPVTPPEEQENLDLWKAMDQGHDPTV
jgi:hypothetical protein